VRRLTDDAQFGHADTVLFYREDYLEEAQRSPRSWEWRLLVSAMTSSARLSDCSSVSIQSPSIATSPLVTASR
jgi:hypothetical protein